MRGERQGQHINRLQWEERDKGNTLTDSNERRETSGPHTHNVLICRNGSSTSLESALNTLLSMVVYLNTWLIWWTTCACLQSHSHCIWIVPVTKTRQYHSIQWPKATQNISTTVHATTKLFVPFYSAQDGESTDMNCLAFWAHCKNGKILMEPPVYIRGFLPIFSTSNNYEILISL